MRDFYWAWHCGLQLKMKRWQSQCLPPLKKLQLVISPGYKKPESKLLVNKYTFSNDVVVHHDINEIDSAIYIQLNIIGSALSITYVNFLSH